ncbi:glycosyltransferase family 4 protein [Winogradskyella thalassocola]|uniref:Glycosyltransferase involved in cell wall bisynthesis n=1 Tax=Winogradskyella thalassocola TaxID=262004 RepID=A0A1G8DJ99_9FLAO|nr:glycosyltransferase family 4 protein [Winogradskyella thalassocola]SDH57714.1 Glycosyltransferase involved in cell wall bisynthesis [Winogradskyella thalassocola]
MKKIIRITTVSGSLKVLLKDQLRFMNEHYEIIGVANNSEDDQLDDVKAAEGIRTIAVSMTREITPLKDLKAVYKLYRIIKKEKPFIVHSHTPKAGTLGMLAAKLAGVPNRLHTIAGLPLLETTGNKRKLLNLVEKYTYECATLILPNSFGLNKIILEHQFCKASKLKVLGNGSSNGIDINHYSSEKVNKKEADSIKQQLNISNNDTVFIFVGRVVKDKGIHELVEAFNSISKLNPSTKLIIVGPREEHLDPIDPHIDEIIRRNKNIHTVGLQWDIRPYVYISDIFVFPSYREGFPNVILQANSMGKPCIVTNINGSNELITHNYNGLIVPPKDLTSLKKAMLYLLSNPSKTLELASNCRENIVKNYKREFIWDEILKLYKSLE